MTPIEIIIHHSAGHDGPGNDTATIRRWDMGTPPNGPADGPYRDISYNALVEQVGTDYETILGRNWTWSGAHTIGENGRSLGLCLIGDFSLTPPPQAQLAKAAKTVAMWMQIYKIPITAVFPHRHFNATACPGAAFPWDAFINLVKEETT